MQIRFMKQCLFLDLIILNLTSQTMMENLLSIVLYALQRESRNIIPETIMVNQNTIHNRIPANPPENILTNIPIKANTFEKQQEKYKKSCLYV